jgi:alpha-L-rhamnosidase
MAVFSGVATPQDDLAIYNEVLRPGTAAWKFDATPYYNNYVIFALSELGHTQDAMDFVRNYWGGMIREGATTFWEGYDESWDKHNFHSHLQADNGTGYFVSLCHGWSAGVTNWLTEEVLGVRSTGAGFKDCDIDPDLGDLQWASGTVPTPSGDIQLSVQRSGDQYVVNVQIPRGVQRATVKVKGAALKVDKGHAPLSETQNNQLVLGPGSYRLKS